MGRPPQFLVSGTVRLSYAVDERQSVTQAAFFHEAAVRPCAGVFGCLFLGCSQGFGDPLPLLRLPIGLLFQHDVARGFDGIESRLQLGSSGCR